MKSIQSIQSELREVQSIIDMINDDPFHPVNDNRHKLHHESIAAYTLLQARIDELLDQLNPMPRQPKKKN